MTFATDTAKSFAAHLILTTNLPGYTVEVIEDCVRLWADGTCEAKAYCAEGAAPAVYAGWQKFEDSFAVRLLQSAADSFTAA